MLIQPTLERLHAMRLSGMAEAFRQQLEDPHMADLAFADRFAMLVESQWLWKQSRATARRLALAKLKQQACLEDIDFRHARGLDKTRFLHLAHESLWVRQKRAVVLLGPTGIGKSFLACALAHKACRDGYSVLYTRMPQLCRELRAARADNSLGRMLARLARVDALVVDDWLIDPLGDMERRDFHEICDDRHAQRATVLASQLPRDTWHERIGDPTKADSILDRLLHGAHVFELRGESLRKAQARAQQAAEEGGAS